MTSRSLGFLLLMMFTATGCSRGTSHGAALPDMVSASGFGRVKIGMSVSEASRALGARLEAADEPMLVQVDCYYVQPHGSSGAISLMVVGSIVVRVDVDRPGVTTSSGIAVGSPEHEIYEAYGEAVEVFPHPFMEPGSHYLIVSVDPEKKMLFETDGRSVLRYRAGPLPYVEWMEGCS